MQNVAKRVPSTISEVEDTIQQSLEGLRGFPFSDEVKAGLNFLLRPGYRPVVQLEEENGRKKRSTAAASNWNPDTGKIVIFFEKIGRSEAACTNQEISLDESSATEAPSITSEPEHDGATPLELQQCCNALAEVEKAGKSFVALKWFRDEALPKYHYDWTTIVDDRQRVLADAIESGLIKTAKTFNPKNPQFPTTSVSLNRTESHSGITPRFSPVPVRGEPVSHTIMRDRGSL